MNHRIQHLKNALADRRAVKMIAGIANFDLENVLAIVKSADDAGATAVDVAATPEIVSAVRTQTDMAVFASSVSPKSLLAAVEAGADVAELGNYDALYEEGLFFGYEDVLGLAKETLALIKSKGEGKALTSITVPGHLSQQSQVRLAVALQELGVDMIQTEGASRELAAAPKIKALTAAEKFEITLSNTRVLTEKCSLPILTASGIHAQNTHLAFTTGAAGVGIGRAVNQLDTHDERVTTLQAIMDQANQSREATLQAAAM
ncbi:MAG: DUF561 domain-containing protein [Vampirovibrio sp.]|nr:DUF561 domain-containing protein [Vampirovibrio sp.]